MLPSNIIRYVKFPYSNTLLPNEILTNFNFNRLKLVPFPFTNRVQTKILFAGMEGQEYKGYIFLSGVGALLILVIAVYKYCGKKYERCCCRRPKVYAEEEEQHPLLL